MKLPSLVYRRYMEDIEVYRYLHTIKYMECIVYRMTVYYRKLRHVH